MENYEQKYKEALNWIRSIYPTMQGAEKEDAEHHFPELKESEDEKIRKVLIKGFQHYDKECKWGEFTTTEILAWLEKQGEQKPANNVEPKFKVGAWITNGDCLWQITNIDRLDYTIKSQNGDVCEDEINFVDNEFHLWTIQDAEDGDVLYHKSPLTGIEYIVMSRGVNDCGTVDSYFRYNSADGFGISVPSVFSTKSDDITPATKEQRDLLFTKMKEAGYEWDDEKKELKQIEQNSAWSEEDKQYLLVCKNALYKYQSSDKWDATIIYNWLKEKLKSLKERVQPQPKRKWSEKDKEMFNCISDSLCYLRKLYELSPDKVRDYNLMLEWFRSKFNSIKEQCKREWSKEDEEIYNSFKVICQKLIENPRGKSFQAESIYAEKMLNWLKSIKDRVQPNKEWSEEDEERLQSCLNILQAKGIMGVTETINTKWLKSLKDKIKGE